MDRVDCSMAAGPMGRVSSREPRFSIGWTFEKDPCDEDLDVAGRSTNAPDRHDECVGGPREGGRCKDGKETRAKGWRKA